MDQLNCRDGLIFTCHCQHMTPLWQIVIVEITIGLIQEVKNDMVDVIVMKI